MPTTKDCSTPDALTRRRAARPLPLAAAADAVSALLPPARRAALRDCPFNRLGRFDHRLRALVRERLALGGGVKVVDEDGRIEGRPDRAALLVLREVWLREQERYVRTHPTTLAATAYPPESPRG